MAIVVLEPNKYKRKRYMQIGMVVTGWDERKRAYMAAVTFNRTRDRPDRKPLGYKVYANNLQTLEQLLLDLTDLYPPARKIAIPLPDQAEPGRLWYSRFVSEDGEEI